jgi:hypothetical protein
MKTNYKSQPEISKDSHIVREMERTLDYMVSHKADEVAIEVMKEAIMHQKITEDVADIAAKEQGKP